jgi:NADH-quinone oxidoreductase subunit N
LNFTFDLKFIFPEILLLSTAIFILVFDLIWKIRRLLTFLAIFSLSITLLLLSKTVVLNSNLFSGMLILDPFSIFFKIISVFIAIIIILISLDYPRISPKFSVEFYSLLLMATVAMMFLAGANNLLMIYLSIEFISLISYILAAYWRGNLRSSESGLKYFFFGTLCSITMLYGISLLYGFTGSLDLSSINHSLFNTSLNPVIIFIAILMVLMGICFKIAMVPVHFWCPDVYEGAPTPVTAFLSVGPKLAGFAVLLRFLFVGSAFFYQHWSALLAILSIFTMSLGNITAISQTNIKRLLAYSSIAHAGYCLIGLVVKGNIGQSSVFIYLLTYIIMNLGAFTVVIAVSNRIKSDEIKDYAGLSLNSPYLALLFTIFLLSLTGLPPLAGFIGKFYIFSAAIKEGFIYLTVAGVINSVIAAYYYFNIIRIMYLVPPSQIIDIKPSLSLNFALFLTVAFTVIIGLYPKPVIDFVSQTLGILVP